MSVSIKVPNNNYTKEFFDDIYSRVLIFGVEKKQRGPIQKYSVLYVFVVIINYLGYYYNNSIKP